MRIMLARSLVTRGTGGRWLGMTHTFQFHAVRCRLVGCLCVAIATAAFGAAIYAPFLPDPKSLSDVAEIILMGISIGLVSAWMGIRQFRCGVQVSGQELTIRNELRTHTVGAADVRAINLQPKDSPNGPYWVPRVELTSGKSIWIDNLDCGPARRPPIPERVALLDEVRGLLRLEDADLIAETGDVP